MVAARQGVARRLSLVGGGASCPSYRVIIAKTLRRASVPLAFEQAAIAERVRRSGAGLVCRPRHLRARLAGAIKEVLGNPAYAEAAATLRGEIRSAGGAVLAADIVEQVARTGRPCLNADAISAEPALTDYGLRTARIA